MAKLVECVPNFSEGRDEKIIGQIVKAVKEVDGVRLLDYSNDKSHNRSVVTFIGEPGAVKIAAFSATRKAAELIDLNKHEGKHPRMGAVDVIPFIPIAGVTMAECVELARGLGKQIYEELNIPVYLYEEAATNPHRKNLADLRRGQFEGLREEIKKRERHPDFGRPDLHPTAGITAVGARMPLIAYNINLATSDVGIAKEIAGSIRGSGGGLRDVKALGVTIKERNIAQVTINVCNYKTAPLYRVFELVKIEADRYGVGIVGSEIVGLTPAEALLDAAEYYLRLENFDQTQALELKLTGMENRTAEREV
ncbi:MAG TPA: glutamate formimidoyltransferase [Clostridia bacterium]|nr:glutamate formimidoyltransferase [Clostridia bacterium]